MTKDEALRLALKALEYHSAQTRPIHETNEAITAIKEALAQPTWVGLDEEDYIKAYELCDFDKDAALEFFEAKLKEKNNG
jgi:hypothetical protein